MDQVSLVQMSLYSTMHFAIARHRRSSDWQNGQAKHCVGDT